MAATPTAPALPASDARALCRTTWWVFALGGAASFAFGVMALLAPGVALLVLSLFFAASVLVDGASSLLGALQNRSKDGWWVMALIGALGILVGGYALLYPPLSIAAFVFVVAFQAIVLGVLVIMLGWRVRLATTREWMLYVIGALSIVFGLLVVINPAAGSLSVVALVAGWAIVTGVTKFVFGLNLKNLPDKA